MRLLIICDQMPTLFRGDRRIRYAVKGAQYFHTRACLDDYDVVYTSNSNIDLDKLDLDKLGVTIHILLTGREVFLFRITTEIEQIEQIGKEITGKSY